MRVFKGDLEGDSKGERGLQTGLVVKLWSGQGPRSGLVQFTLQLKFNS